MKVKPFLDILVRYAILLGVAIPNFYIFYFIFAPLTVYPTYFILNLFFGATLHGNIILVREKFTIELIGACIAGSAYYLLLILNLATPKIEFPKRIKMILFSFGSFLILNILRIFLLGFLLIQGSSFFDITHKVFWYLVSIVFVVGIWFLEVKIFRIKSIPFYSDLKFLFKNSTLKK